MKRFATRSTLLMTRRPSASTLGSVENLSSSRTSWATARDAELPDPMAMPMSASLRASTSFTPSPVMATVWPRACRASIMARFWWGVTRPNTAPAATASDRASGSSGRSLASTHRSAPGTPARRATAATVAGWSPEITLRLTPCSANQARISGASGLTVSSRRIRHIGSRAAGSVLASHEPAVERVSTRTRWPASANSATRSRATAHSPFGSRTSGAPRW